MASKIYSTVVGCCCGLAVALTVSPLLSQVINGPDAAVNIPNNYQTTGVAAASPVVWEVEWLGGSTGEIKPWNDWCTLYATLPGEAVLLITTGDTATAWRRIVIGGTPSSPTKFADQLRMSLQDVAIPSDGAEQLRLMSAAYDAIGKRILSGELSEREAIEIATQNALFAVIGVPIDPSQHDDHARGVLGPWVPMIDVSHKLRVAEWDRGMEDAAAVWSATAEVYRELADA